MENQEIKGEIFIGNYTFPVPSSFNIYTNPASNHL